MLTELPFIRLANQSSRLLIVPSSPAKPSRKVRKSSLVNFGASVNAKPKDLLVVNPNYNGTTDTELLVPTSEGATFLLRGDSILCVQIEFEIDPTKTDKYPWMLSASVTRTCQSVSTNKLAANGL